MKKQVFWKKAVFWILFCEAVGGIASWLTRDGLRIFAMLTKPALTPPRIVFPIVWSILLLLMGFGFALVRHTYSEPGDKDRADIAFAVQLTFFFCWMIWFFGLEWFGFAAIWLAGMILAILCMIRAFRKLSAPAAWMQIPYLLWCGFALYLNIGVWTLNH